MSKILANQIANYGDDSPIEVKEGLNIPAGKPLQAAGSSGTSGQVLSATGTSVQWVTPFDGSYNSLTNQPTIPAAQVPADWNATGGSVAAILNKPIVPAQPSVSVETPSANGNLTYNQVSGLFTFTPPDLSSYLTSLGDAAGVTNAKIVNWDTAYGWGNHAGAGYLTTYTETDTLDTVTGRNGTTANTIQVGRIDIGSGSQSIIPSGTNDVTFQNTFTGGTIFLRAAGNVEIQSYQGSTLLKTNTGAVTTGGLSLYYATGLTTEVVRLTTTSTGLTLNGNVELGSGDLTTTGKVYFSNNFADLTALNAVNAGTYHGMFAHVHSEGHGYFAHAGGWIQMLDTGSSLADLADVNLATAPQTGQVLKYDGANWVAAADGTGGGGIALTDLSVTTAAAGTAALSYNNVSGVFTYTPPDLSGYITAETDPVFSAHVSSGILQTNINNWNAAYGWGDHSTAGYATTTALNTAVANSANWDTAYGWGNHASAGYLTSYTEADTLATVTGRGATTSTQIISSGGFAVGQSNGSGNLTLTQDGTQNSLISHLGTGSLTLKTNNNNGILIWADDSGSDIILRRGTGVGVVNRLATTSTGVTITGALTAGGLTYPTSNGTSGQVLTSDGAGNVSWQDSTGGGGANVTISDTAPGSATAGDLWWESDKGRLKIYYNDTDSFQWVDASPPLADATSIGGQGTVAMLASLIPDVNDAYDLGSAEYKIRDIYEADPSDARLKTDVVDYTGGLEFVESLRVVDFTWKKDVDVKAGKRETGLIAQEVKEALDASNYNSWRLHTDGDTQGVDKKQLIPALISAIQELSARVKELENK